MIFAFIGRDDYRRRAALASALSARRLADSRAGGLFLPGLFDLEKEGGLASALEFISSSGLFSAKKAVILENVLSEEVTAKELKALLRLAADAPETAVYISEASLPKDLRELIGKNGEVVSFEELRGGELKKYILAEAKQAGLALSDEAAGYLAEAFPGNSWAIATEIKKAVFLGPGEVALTGLRALGVKKRGAFFELLSGWGGKSAGERMLNLEVLFSDREDPAKIFNILAYTDPARIGRFADLDVAVKSGSMDYEEALVSLALG